MEAQNPPEPTGDKMPSADEAKKRLMAATGADRMILIAGLVFFVDSFLPWYGVSLRGFGVNLSSNISGWSSGGWAVIAILAAIAATVFAAIRVVGVSLDLGGVKDGVVYLALGGAAFVFSVLRLITAASLTKFGLYIAIIAGAVLAYGGYMKYSADK